MSAETRQQLGEPSQLQQACPDLEAMFMYLSEKVLSKDESMLVASLLKVATLNC